MYRIARALVAAAAFTAPAAFAQPVEVTLARLECGTPTAGEKGRFSDTFAYSDPTWITTYSCYLIRHGNDYMVWDTGNAMGRGAAAPKVSLVDQLAQVNVQPEQVKYVGISHFHGDHTGQLPSFPNATLLIGEREWAAITAPKPMPGANVAAFAHWAGGGGKVEAQALDKDVFGDGTVRVLRTPGHTPGHQSLLVRLKDMGAVLLSGDAVHLHENYETNGVPVNNFDRADTLASMERLRQIQKSLKATVIIQHDPRDVGKLPAWPASAK